MRTLLAAIGAFLLAGLGACDIKHDPAKTGKVTDVTGRVVKVDFAR